MNLNSVRLLALITEYQEINSAANLILGRGLQYVLGWDIFSVSIKGLGIIIFIQLVFSLLVGIKYKFTFVLLLFTLGISTGSLLEPVYILMIFLFTSSVTSQKNET